MLARNPNIEDSALSWNEFVDEIQGAVWDHCVKTRHNIRDVAAKAHLSPMTVSRFMSRETQHPRYETVLALAYIAGYEHRWVRVGAPRLKGQLDLRIYRSKSTRK